jgi:hypothetical protein
MRIAFFHNPVENAARATRSLPLPTGLRSGTQFSTAYRSERSERASPHRGYCERFSIRNRLQKFLSFFETVYSTISPVSACNCSKNVSGPVSTRPTISILSKNMCLAEHSCINSRKLLFNQAFNLICDKFMFILSTIGTT